MRWTCVQYVIKCGFVSIGEQDNCRKRKKKKRKCKSVMIRGIVDGMWLSTEVFLYPCSLLLK